MEFSSYRLWKDPEWVRWRSSKTRISWTSWCPRTRMRYSMSKRCVFSPCGGYAWARARTHTYIYIYILSPWMFKFCMSLNFSGCIAIRLWTCTMWRATRGKESKADIQNKVDNRQAPRASSSQTRNLSRKHQVKDLQIKGNQNDEPS